MALYFLNGKEAFAFMMLCALGHEAGHLVAMLLCGVKPLEITVGFLNFNIKYNKSKTTYKKDLLISSGGVIVNFILTLLGYFFGDFELFYTNAVLMIINLLPISTLDGANIAVALKGCFGKKEREGYSKLYKRISGAFAVAVLAVFCDFNLSFVFTGVFALISGEVSLE